MEILNFRDNSLDINSKLKSYLESYFDSDTLVINDTRAVIIPEVLPHIEFVGSYDQRILSMLNNTNIVVSKPFYTNIIDYMNKLGLAKNLNVVSFENQVNKTLAEIILEDKEKIEILKSLNLKKMAPFFVDDKASKLASKLGLHLYASKKIFDLANDKLKLKQFLEEKKLPTIEGEITSNPVLIKEYFNKKEMYVFKDPLGVSGYGFWNNKDNKLEEILDNYAKKEIIIEKFITKESSPSIQFFIKSDKEAIIFGFTDQILEKGQYYLGNSSPSIYATTSVEGEAIRQAEYILEWLGDLGYIGFGSIDLIVTKDKKVYATEVNARLTGGTYPTITSFLLTGKLDSIREYKTIENVEENIETYLKNSVKNSTDKGIFPICITPLDNWDRVQVMEIK